MFRRHTSVPFGGVEHAQLAFRAQRIEAAFVVCRRRARTVAAHRFLEVRRPRVRPELAPAVDCVSRRNFLIPPLLDGERATLGDDKRGVAAADRLLPERAKSLTGPAGANRACVTAVALRTAEIGPGIRCARCVGCVGCDGCDRCDGCVRCVRCDRCDGCDGCAGCVRGIGLVRRPSTRARGALSCIEGCSSVRSGGGCGSDLTLARAVGLENGVVIARDEPGPAAARALKAKARGNHAGYQEDGNNCDEAEFPEHEASIPFGVQTPESGESMSGETARVVEPRDCGNVGVAGRIPCFGDTSHRYMFRTPSME